MKKLFSICVLACFAVLGTSTNVSAQTTKPKVVESMWTRTQTWVGKDMNKYKLENATVKFSTDNGTTWNVVTSGVWNSKDGKFYKIAENKVMVSTNGTTWAEAPGWKWIGFDGKTYKLDNATWALMVM